MTSDSYLSDNALAEYERLRGINFQAPETEYITLWAVLSPTQFETIKTRTVKASHFDTHFTLFKDFVELFSNVKDAIGYCEERSFGHRVICEFKFDKANCIKAIDCAMYSLSTDLTLICSRHFNYPPKVAPD